MITITRTRTPATVSTALTNGMAAAAIVLLTILLLSSGATHVVEAFTGIPHTHYNHHRYPGRRPPGVEGAATVTVVAPGTQPPQQPHQYCSSNNRGLRMSDDDDDDDENDEEDQNNEDDNFDDKNEKEMIMYVMGDDDSKVVSYDDDTDAYDKEDDDDDDDDDVDDDPYTQVAHSEFRDDADNADKDTTPDDASSSITTTTSNANASASSSTSALTTTTEINWSSALAQLSHRVDDIEQGVSQNPAQTLFRMMSSETPNQMIGTFVATANPTVVQAMSGAITSLLGGLSNPSLGIDTLVKAPRSKIGTLCFQLQMTGYMFRNAEYVLALKELMHLQPRTGTLTMDDYAAAFARIDTDQSGYIEISEIKQLFVDAYGGHEHDIPIYEITAFLDFFDSNEDGKICWEDFQKGLVSSNTLASANTDVDAKTKFANRLLASMEEEDDDDDDDDEEDVDNDDVQQTISGTIEIEMDDGNVIKVDAKQYMTDLKEEAKKLKLLLRQERGGMGGGGSKTPTGGRDGSGGTADGTSSTMDIATYLASRRGDVKSLTEGIKPEIVETMQKLVEFVLEGEAGDISVSSTQQPRRSDTTNNNNSNNNNKDTADDELELPGSALQQLALWQLVLGYRLREEEAKGDYVKLLEG